MREWEASEREAEAEAEERREGEGNLHFTSFRFHSIPFSLCFFIFLLAPKISLRCVFCPPFLRLPICLEKSFSFLLSFFLSPLECLPDA
jgi:hypothetical protein